MWLGEVQAKAKRKNQILFSKDSILFARLTRLIGEANRRALILWALELAQESAEVLTEKYPEDRRPQEAVEAAGSWARGEIKMPLAKGAILGCHAMAKALTDPADIALCHAVGQGCSVVHTPGHALGYPMYALTALVLEAGCDHCREAVEARVEDYAQRLLYWKAQEADSNLTWAGFLQKEA